MKLVLNMVCPIAVAIVLLSYSADAQCVPEWDGTMGVPGISTGYIDPIVAWDNGSGEKLFAGGSATNIGGDSASDFIGQYDPNTGRWSPLGSGINQGTTNAFLTMILPWDDGNGEKLYVTGQFASAGGLSDANSFAVWDGSNWAAAGAGFTQADLRVTYDMLPADFGDGEKLYLGGNWSSIGGQTVSGVAWFDGTTFGAWGTGDGVAAFGGFDPFVNDLHEWDDGNGQAIYACGRFLGIDNAASALVARFNVATAAWEAFGQPLIPTSLTQGLYALEVFDDGNGEAIYVAGGSFQFAGDANVYRVAKWDGNQWTGVGQTLSGNIFDLEVWDDGNGPGLYLCGAGLNDVNDFAKLVNGNWEVAESGINNPSVTGGGASAFGLYVWGDDLAVGGSFSQVGGMDPVSGVGTGTPIAARGIATLRSCTQILLGDVNEDGVVDLLDVAPFVQLIANGDFHPAADINQDGLVDLLDVGPFVLILTG